MSPFEGTGLRHTPTRSLTGMMASLGADSKGPAWLNELFRKRWQEWRAGSGFAKEFNSCGCFPPSARAHKGAKMTWTNHRRARAAFVTEFYFTKKYLELPVFLMDPSFALNTSLKDIQDIIKSKDCINH